MNDIERIDDWLQKLQKEVDQIKSDHDKLLKENYELSQRVKALEHKEE